MKQFLMILMTGFVLLLAGCSLFIDSGHLQNAGMLVETSIDNQPWNQKGYDGLQAIEDTYNTDVFYKEEIKTKDEVRQAVDEFADKGVNLIFGNSSSYGKYFEDLSETYPGIHFVYFNGEKFAERVTSLNFNSHAMGFFAGMLAGKMSHTNQVGVIGVFDWQAEIEGFYAGVKYQDPEVKVHLNYVNDWNNKDRAMQMYDELRNDHTDVIYPAGNAYSQKVIKRSRNDGIYTIGYIADQSEIAEQNVLTSTVQDIETLYKRAAENVNEGDLRGGVLTYDFQDDVISLGQFSPDVPESFQKKLQEEVDAYKDTGILPNERENEQGMD
ncbi:transcriptional regulator Med [Barrientosiimonas marina]|uniref:BMP family ABC transporter substrate-binding protein n=1 Tax=Lentibacillus kimchii TaxID=1542911 RepID=A0ABW2UQN9_9BACI